MAAYHSGGEHYVSSDVWSLSSLSCLLDFTRLWFSHRALGNRNIQKTTLTLSNGYRRNRYYKHYLAYFESEAIQKTIPDWGVLEERSMKHS